VGRVATERHLSRVNEGMRRGGRSLSSAAGGTAIPQGMTANRLLSLSPAQFNQFMTSRPGEFRDHG
jgi:hypothetical protein